jgi:hypothetical protein
LRQTHVNRQVQLRQRQRTAASPRSAEVNRTGPDAKAKRKHTNGVVYHDLDVRRRHLQLVANAQLGVHLRINEDIQRGAKCGSERRRRGACERPVVLTDLREHEAVAAAAAQQAVLAAGRLLQ